MTADLFIVVPCYNGAMFIADCLDSIRDFSLNNHHINVTCIFVNDGSTDNTKEVIEIPIEIDSPRLVCMQPYSIADRNKPVAKGGLELSRYTATGVRLVAIIILIMALPQRAAQKAH